MGVLYQRPGQSWLAERMAWVVCSDDGTQWCRVYLHFTSGSHHVTTSLDGDLWSIKLWFDIRRILPGCESLSTASNVHIFSAFGYIKGGRRGKEDKGQG